MCLILEAGIAAHIITERCSGNAPQGRGRSRSSSSSIAGEMTTPARAGTMPTRVWNHVLTTDYPRSRGDDGVSRSARGRRRGLPPLARGRPVRQTQDQAEARTTPARAGTTACDPQPFILIEDYPRSRGDDEDAAATDLPVCGLPPPARGRLRRGDDAIGIPGTTPARAGTTKLIPLLVSEGRDYPRSRGDDRKRLSHCYRRHGLPPLARGRLWVERDREG